MSFTLPFVGCPTINPIQCFTSMVCPQTVTGNAAAQAGAVNTVQTLSPFGCHPNTYLPGCGYTVQVCPGGAQPQAGGATCGGNGVTVLPPLSAPPMCPYPTSPVFCPPNATVNCTTQAQMGGGLHTQVSPSIGCTVSYSCVQNTVGAQAQGGGIVTQTISAISPICPPQTVVGSGCVITNIPFVC